MPRRLKDTTLDTRTARLELKARRAPYWRRVDRTRHLGYRRNRTGAGTWIARIYTTGEGYREHRLGMADDFQPANGVEILDFDQAQEKAREWFDQVRLGPSAAQSYTVADAMADYLAWFKAHRKSHKSTSYAVEAHILPTLGQCQVNALTTRQLAGWHRDLAAAGRRLRTRKGTEQRFAPVEEDPDEARKRKATANRVLGILRAGLNHAYGHQDPAAGIAIPSAEAWRRVKPFRGADLPKVRFLEEAEIRRLLNVVPADFGRLVRGALFTGCRYGELGRARVRDYSSDTRALHVYGTKSGTSRDVYLTDEGDAFFQELTAARSGEERIFLRGDRQWQKDEQVRPMLEACRAAEITPPASFHFLRHTYASLYLMSGGSLEGLSKQLGHADTRMTIRHYGHLAASWRAEEARRHAPRLGQQVEGGKVRRIG